MTKCKQFIYSSNQFVMVYELAEIGFDYSPHRYNAYKLIRLTCVSSK